MADEINRAVAEDAVGAVAGDAGASRHGRRSAPRHAGAVPRARDAEPAGAGGHLSAARSAARPLPAADRRRPIPISPPSAGCCSRPPAPRSARLETDHDGPGADGDPAARAPDPGAGQGRRGDPEARALGASGRRCRYGSRPASRLGAWSARQPGADAGRARQGADRRPSRAVGRRRRRAGRADPQAPHGADVRCARRGPGRLRRHRAPGRAGLE